MKIRYFFPTGIMMIVFLVISGLFCFLSGIIAESNYDLNVLYNGQCSVSLNKEKQNMMTNCGKYDTEMYVSTNTVWKIYDKKNLECTVFENFRGKRSVRCEY